MTRAQTIAHRFRWVLLVAGLIGLAAGAWWLATPLIGGMDYGAGLLGVIGFGTNSEWLYGLVAAGYLGAFFITQWLFLRPRRRWVVQLTDTGRPMKKSVFTAALIAATLSVGVIATLLEIPNWWTKIVLSVPVRAANGPRARYWPALAALALAWVFWAWVFFVYWRQGDRYTQFGRMIRGLLGGSVLEVFIATGVQAFTYKRDDCYCCRGSYTGLVFGGTALLWAFGPGVALLFARERYRQHKLLPLCLECGYDLRGTLAAGRDTCPECGAAITHAQLPTGDEPPSPLPPFPPST